MHYKANLKTLSYCTVYSTSETVISSVIAAGDAWFLVVAAQHQLVITKAMW